MQNEKPEIIYREVVLNPAADAMLIAMSNSYPRFDDFWLTVEFHLSTLIICAQRGTDDITITKYLPNHICSELGAERLNVVLTIEHEQVFVNEIVLG